MKKIFGIAIPSLLLFACAASAQEFGPWSAPVNLGPTVNTASSDQHPALSKDGLSLYFTTAPAALVASTYGCRNATASTARGRNRRT